MKKYNLSAEFVRWEGSADQTTVPDSFGYVIELESEEEAKVRLDSLIIDRMSSKSGWSYKLVSSNLSEFLSNDIKDLPLIIEEQSNLSEQTDISESPLVPDVETGDDNIPLDQVSV